MGKHVVRYFGRGNTKYGKNQKHNSLHQIHGLRLSVFENKDSPDYKPKYGKTFTERQLRILNEEIPLDEVRLTEVSLIKRKAEALGDVEKAEIADYLYKLKTTPETYEFVVKKEEAKDVLQSLTPWEIDWEKQK